MTDQLNINVSYWRRKEGKIWSKGSSQEDLINNLYAICLLKLNKGMHSDAGVSIEILGGSFFLN
jgi:hypothetical protein